jgi:hypothetical protein
MMPSTFVRARTTARLIEDRALAAGLPATVARECGRRAARAVITGQASPARLLARQGRRPRARTHPELPA